VNVLVHRISGPRIPGAVGYTLTGGQDVEALIAFEAEKVPSALQMTDEAVGFVLGRDADAPNFGIERVRERKIDNPGLASEIARGLRALFRQFKKAAALTAGKDIGHGRTRERGTTIQHDDDLYQRCKLLPKFQARVRMN